MLHRDVLAERVMMVSMQIDENIIERCWERKTIRWIVGIEFQLVNDEYVWEWW